MKKKVLLGLALLFITFLVYQRIVNGDKIDKRNTERAKADSIAANIEAEASSKIDVALKAEPKILDFTITESNVLYAVVKSDGTNRNGYAEYLCQVLKDNGAKKTRVKIVEFGTSKSPERDNPYGILLGESNCQF